jgi:hypothetical protein
MTTKFLKDEIINHYGVPNCVFTNNDGEWVVEFDINACKIYGIIHQYMAPQWPHCNGMVECMIKTLKCRFMVMISLTKNFNSWDTQLQRVLFGYKGGIQASFKFSPLQL